MPAQPLVYSLSPEVTIALFNTGDLYFDLHGLTATEDEWRPRYSQYFAEPQIVPVQCMLVQTPAATVLVDAGSYTAVPSDSLLRTSYREVTFAGFGANMFHVC